MAFDFATKLLDDDGQFDDDEVRAYTDELLRLFDSSPEGREAPRGAWARWLVEYGLNHVGVTPATMTARALSELLYEVFPEKISCEPKCASKAIAELRGFFAFAKREFGFARADECLNVLGGDAETRFEKALADPANWGMAKSFVMEGTAAGFDMTTKDGLDAWMQAYNAGLQARTLPPLEPIGSLMLGSSNDDRRSREERRRKRKMQKAGRKRSR